MEPAFLRDHPGLGDLYKKLEKPTAAIVTTNGDWVLTTVKKLLPQVDSELRPHSLCMMIG